MNRMNKMMGAIGMTLAVSAVLGTMAGRVDASLLARWSFEDGSGFTVADVTGNGNNATINGTGYTWGAGKWGGGLNTTAAGGNSVTVPWNPAWDGLTAITLEAWVKLDASLGSRGVLRNEGALVMFHLRDDASGWREIHPGGGSGYTGVVAPVDDWTYVAFTDDGSVANFYIDGALVFTGPATSPVVGAPGTNNLGLNSTGDGLGQIINGTIDEMRIWNVALSADQIALNATQELAVPEPASLALLGLGGLLMLARLRRVAQL